mmetsp:Transcript_60353/g.186851  ORF Transcript_60353/g.186851 Transcript_60353/m.186851 type:complete len:139 (+) Transcript_60353:2-418(+)
MEADVAAAGACSCARSPTAAGGRAGFRHGSGDVQHGALDWANYGSAVRYCMDPDEDVHEANYFPDGFYDSPEEEEEVSLASRADPDDILSCVSSDCDPTERHGEFIHDGGYSLDSVRGSAELLAADISDHHGAEHSSA